ncbi:hypothetical protein AB0B45_33000 [Nonomuraea sp. NPDC049152]|uniref:hypothetical protein n=1 Tax=Nonomuraea sp. NPDC049152 TaxID=3154350 RepID=UPI0033E00692
MLLRSAYLTVTTTFSFLRLLPRSDHDKDMEILVLRHQLTVLERQAAKPALTPEDRFLLAGLLCRPPMDQLRHITLLVHPDTVLRWHRDFLRRRHAAASALRRRGRPRTVRSIRISVLRLARENSSRGYRRIHGELAGLGVKIAASTVRGILKGHGIDPSPGRTAITWSAFLRSQAGALVVCDLVEVSTLTGARLYVLAVVEHATRRVRILGVTPHPTGQWVTQLVRNLVMDLPGAGRTAKFLIRDRDAKFTAAFDAVLLDAGMRVVKTGVRILRMNSIMERWIQTCRRELLDRTLIWNQRHLLHALRECETFYNEHRSHRLLDRQLRCDRFPIRVLTQPGSRCSISADMIDLAGALKEYRHTA